MLKNPIMPASGTFGMEMSPFIDFNRLGAIVPKSITLNERPGNKGPRICETEGGMINSIGIQSKGIDYYIDSIIPDFAKYNVPLIASISGDTIDEFAVLAQRLSEIEKVAALELNISCPNLRNDGIAFGMNEKTTEELVGTVRQATDRPLIVKLSPNVTHIQDIACAAEKGGADALTVANTFLAMAIDTETRRPKIGNLMGGFSGPAVRPLIIRLIFQVHQVTALPIIGSGGVMTGRDVIEMMLAGASAVQVGTANFIRPVAMLDIIDEVTDYMIRHHIDRIADLVGKIDLDEREKG